MLSQNFFMFVNIPEEKKKNTTLNVIRNSTLHQKTENHWFKVPSSFIHLKKKGFGGAHHAQKENFPTKWSSGSWKDA